MKITVIGTGYVGLVAGTCFADMGNEVICVDSDAEKLSKLKSGIVPIYEPGLEELIKVNVAEKRLLFSSELEPAVKASEICFITVGTPQDSDGSADLQHVLGVAENIAKYMNGYKVIVNKSTVPVGTAEKVAEVVAKHTKYGFDIVSNPEFLKQGNAVEDFLYPDRVVIGSNSDKATAIMQELYSPFLRTGNRVILMDVKSAEMTKYASNAFLATKISFMNEMANLCERTGADVEMVRIGISTDSRIGNKSMFPGLGYGGSCFPKDVKALIRTGSEFGLDMNIVNAVDKTNENQKNLFVKKITLKFGNDLKNKKFAIWGLSFKPMTDDMRQAPSITIINELLKRNAVVQVYDPKAIETAQKIFKNNIIYSKTSYEALMGADAVLLLTEWREFRHPDFERMKELLKNPIIFDGRNQYNPKRLEQIGFSYISIGR